MGISTIGKIVATVCRTIWSELHQECLPTPNIEDWESIACDFQRHANFPHCLGAVDGKHIRLVSPIHSGSMYFNYKEYHSVVLMAIADSKYRFIYVDVGSYGKECDSTIFNKCKLWKAIENGTVAIPEDKCLPGTECPKVPFFFIGDEGFALHENLLRPYGGTHLTGDKWVFNYRLCRARRFAECTFGIFSNKWRIFHRPINLKPDYAVLIVKACVVLHNFVRDRDGIVIEDTTTIVGLQDLQGSHNVRGGLSANNVRNTLCKYFLTDIGAVPWQMSKV